MDITSTQQHGARGAIVRIAAVVVAVAMLIATAIFGVGRAQAAELTASADPTTFTQWTEGVGNPVDPRSTGRVWTDKSVTTGDVTLDAGDGSEPRELPVVAMVKEDFSKLSDAARAKAPVIRPETDRVDFGRLDRHQSATASRSITLRNAGRSPLLIRRVYSGDKGIEASVSSEKIKAGKTAVLTLNVDPSQLPGDILNARVQVISNDPSAPVVTIRAVGELK